MGGQSTLFSHACQVREDEDFGDDLGDKKAEEDGEEDTTEAKKSSPGLPWEGSDRDYTYEELLGMSSL